MKAKNEPLGGGSGEPSTPLNSFTCGPLGTGSGVDVGHAVSADIGTADEHPTRKRRVIGEEGPNRTWEWDPGSSIERADVRSAGWARTGHEIGNAAPVEIANGDAVTEVHAGRRAAGRNSAHGRRGP